MSSRLAGAVLLLAAAGVWLAVTVPAQGERDAARTEYGRAREQKEKLRVELASAERRAVAGMSPQAGAAASRGMRASLLRAIEGLRVEGVQIAPAERRSGGAGRLSAEGRMAEVALLADRLVSPGSGVLVRSVHFVSASGSSPTVRLDVDCSSGSVGP